MKMAFVAGGYIPTPPVSSSILTPLQEYKYHSEKNGHQVDVFNHHDVQHIVSEINSCNYDFIHLHTGGFIR
jgi:hypothetical protein